MISVQWIIVGLGNPGPRYHDTRHNIGFLVADLFRSKERFGRYRQENRSEVATGRVKDNGVTIVKPLTFMNCSGEILPALIKRYDVDLPDGLVVVHDDLDFLLGRIVIRKNGGSGGHKGVDSIIQALGSADFTRVRLGIGRPPGQEVVGYVLDTFSNDEKEPAAHVVTQAAQSLSLMVRRGVQAAMNRYNGVALKV